MHLVSRCFHLLALMSCCYTHSHAFTLPITVPFQSPSSTLFGESVDKSSYNDDRMMVDVSSVTDAEALLACRAYLQRKNRLGSWKDYQRRQESLRQASASGSTGISNVGYFWENPEELVYLNLHEQDEEEMMIMMMQEEEMEELHGVVVESAEEENGGTTMILGTTTLSALERGAEFTSLPTRPSQERVNRSNAAKKTWSDPEWKAKWYEKRWGRLRNMTPSASKQKRLDDRIRSVAPNMFESQELSALTEEEIEEAIRTYVVSNRKRSRAHTTDAKEKKKRAQQQEAERRQGTDRKAKLDFLFGSHEAMKEAQRKRSKRATKAYQTRLANQNKNRPASKDKQSITIVPTDSLPSGGTPKDAIVRAQAALVSNQLPSIADVELILEPSKLGRRKDLLRRILNEYFDLRGKCVPADPSTKRKSSDLLFVTQCSIDQLGSFVLTKMKESENKGSEER